MKHARHYCNECGSKIIEPWMINFKIFNKEFWVCEVHFSRHTRKVHHLDLYKILEKNNFRI